MILLTVGTQFPFDRLVRTVDSWAVENNRDDVVAQIGPSTYVPKALKCFSMISPDEFKELQLKSKVIIAHAGMGSILTALDFGKPIIIMPRDHTLGEHRNAHQLATANKFGHMAGIYVVTDADALLHRLNNLDELVASRNASVKAPEGFTSKIQAFIEEDAPSLSWRERLFGTRS